MSSTAASWEDVKHAESIARVIYELLRALGARHPTHAQYGLACWAWRAEGDLRSFLTSESEARAEPDKCGSQFASSSHYAMVRFCASLVGIT